MLNLKTSSELDVDCIWVGLDCVRSGNYNFLWVGLVQIGFTLPGFTFLVLAHPGSPGQIPAEQ